jgi:hypothetical protein|tara:strand:- start:9506 stop:9805 length:300 start_codon:yes stop_codon:yes gene_type:complete
MNINDIINSIIGIPYKTCNCNGDERLLLGIENKMYTANKDTFTNIVFKLASDIEYNIHKINKDINNINNIIGLNISELIKFVSGPKICEKSTFNNSLFS